MKRLSLLIVCCLAAAVLVGCGGSGSPTGVSGTSSPSGPLQGSPEDRADVEAAAARYPEFMEDAVYASGAAMSDQTPSLGRALSTEAPIEPITFSRRFRVTDQQFEYAFSDTDSTGRPTSAILTVHRTLTGKFQILAADTTGGFNDPVRISKPLSEHWVRRLQFTRVSSGSGGRDDDDDDDKGKDDDIRQAPQAGVEGGDRRRGKDRKRDRGRWELVAVSAVQIRSANDGAEITSLRFEAAGLDTTIDDPLALHAVESLPLLAPGTEVTITATTSSADDIVLLLARDRRVRLESSGGNSFTGTFIVPEVTGSQHFGVNVLSRETLYDDAAPYESETWLAPVRSGSFRLSAR
jgi:hypothetical protein